ncbi:Hpt domain-containing protein [Cavenderia fasciculata]|uniref:Hpt domain-containing protein n=1 Tax=Cavenderia fasciculata TaxID=261658 RepID=F4PY94_CACFS|nr:Hpt domain-containing protein [Cavenderia fasciculata]EGG19361.1 Hpt domain-containing protein [Cavenderia fasciculata]|eukprot:XP_004357632.1 Hpt domain-containing protein [Cavenderia fasciculata]
MASQDFSGPTPTDRFQKEVLADYSDGDQEFENELITSYIASVEEHLPKLDLSLKELDEKESVLHSHDIKGSSSYIGAESVRFLSGKIEHLCKDGHLKKASEHVQELQKEVTAVFIILRKHMNGESLELTKEDQDQIDAVGGGGTSSSSSATDTNNETKKEQPVETNEQQNDNNDNQQQKLDTSTTTKTASLPEKDSEKISPVTATETVVNNNNNNNQNNNNNNNSNHGDSSCDASTTSATTTASLSSPPPCKETFNTKNQTTATSETNNINNDNNSRCTSLKRVQRLFVIVFY